MLHMEQENFHCETQIVQTDSVSDSIYSFVFASFPLPLHEFSLRILHLVHDRPQEVLRALKSLPRFFHPRISCDQFRQI